jgi:hypothetical protein
MFVDVMIRRRSQLDEPISELNRRLVERLVAVPSFWGQGKTAADRYSNKSRLARSIADIQSNGKPPRCHVQNKLFS